MKVYTYSESRQKLSKLLDIARSEEVIIKWRGGETFILVFKKSPKSPFDVRESKQEQSPKTLLNQLISIQIR